MISSIVFINTKGEILIYKVYKDDCTFFFTQIIYARFFIRRTEIVQFCSRMIATKEYKENPINYINGTSFLHVVFKDIILLATTKSNINVAMGIQFLYEVIQICKSYFNGDFDENNIKKYFVLIYELLDEVMDYGIPQITNFKLLQEYIKEGGVSQQTLSNTEKLRQLTTQATGIQQWRPDGLNNHISLYFLGIVHKKNEVYIDVVEFVNLLCSQKGDQYLQFITLIGTILRTDVSGIVQVKTQLSGVPECKFGMNDKLLMQKESTEKGQPASTQRGITIDDIKFHQCVKLGKFDKERAITFVPPDGSFDLMTYRITENINLPFKLIPVISEYEDSVMGKKRIEAQIKLKSIFEKNIFATNVELKMPCPKNTSFTNISCQMGRAKYEPDKGGIIWSSRIKKFPGDFESLLRCEITIAPGSGKQQVWVKPPIALTFQVSKQNKQMVYQVPMFTASGLRVRFLRVAEKSGYRPTKWIRYITKGGEYLHRL